MNEREKDIRDLDALWESVARDFQELAQSNLSPEQREQIRVHAQWAIEEGRAIFRRLTSK